MRDLSLSGVQMHVDAQTNVIENVNFVRIKDNATVKVKVRNPLRPDSAHLDNLPSIFSSLYRRLYPPKK
eukprot:1220026-Pyramimonas_sp.AAC.1